MTFKELIGAMVDANDTRTQKLGVYDAAVVNATLRKNGLTTLTFKVNVGEFTPNDVLTGVKAWVCIGTVDALQSLAADPPKEQA